MKKKSIILDIDGTLADTPPAAPDTYHQVDWEARNEQNIYSPAFQWAVDMAHIYQEAGYHIVFLTARDDSERTRSATVQWIQRNLPFIHKIKLFMRTPGDFRLDHIVKSELYMEHIFPEYDVKLFVDDKEKNCEAFRAFGIPSLCCGAQ